MTTLAPAASPAGFPGGVAGLLAAELPVAEEEPRLGPRGFVIMRITKTLAIVPVVTLVAALALSACGGSGSSPSAAANAVMQLDDSYLSSGTDPI